MGGLHICVEGPDGAGKTTVVEALVKRLADKGHVATAYRNPGATLLGKEIRQLVKYRKDIDIDRYTEQVMLAADLCFYINKIVKPALAGGQIVVSDRSNFISGMIYGRAGGCDWDQIDALHHVALATNPPPMHVLLLVGDYEALKKRHHHDTEVVDGVSQTVECKIQSRGDFYHKRVTELYQDMQRVATRSPDLIMEHQELEMYRRLSKFVETVRRRDGSTWLSIHPIDVSTGDVEQVMEAVMLSVGRMLEAERLLSALSVLTTLPS